MDEDERRPGLQRPSDACASGGKLPLGPTLVVDAGDVCVLGLNARRVMAQHRGHVAPGGGEDSGEMAKEALTFPVLEERLGVTHPRTLARGEYHCHGLCGWLLEGVQVKPIPWVVAMSTHIDYEREILKLKKSLNAVILAHYYQESEIQDVADFIGDSLALAQQAAQTKANTIVFCGVHFMAETAKILNPGKLVLLPDLAAGCSLADRCPPDAFKRFTGEHANAFVVSYVNCSAAVKAMSDVICTSSNAERIVNRVPKDRQIIFAPDQHLGRYVMQKTGRDMVLWPGSCIVHEIFSEKKLVQLMVQHPDAEVVAHPECEQSVLRHAHYIGSTKGILDRVVSSPKEKFIVVTEAGILHQMQKLAPGKTFIPAPPDNGCACNECPYMKLNTMEKLYLCMRDRRPELVLPPEVQQAALIPLRRMLEWS
jgi:quinolinate synthase